MAKIIRNPGPVANDADLTQAQEMVINYWGALTNEKMFVLPFWEAAQMFAISDSNEIALRVTNIENSNYLSASWVVFEQRMADSLQDPVESHVCYFVMGDNFFNGKVFTDTQPIFELDGIFHANETPHNNVIRARIGTNTERTEFTVFFLAAECRVIDPGGGGGGVISGAKVPSGSD